MSLAPGEALKRPFALDAGLEFVETLPASGACTQGNRTKLHFQGKV